VDYNALENPLIFGKLPPGDAVTIRLVRYPGAVVLTPTSDVCAETPIPGYFVFDFNQITRDQLPPTTAMPSTVLYVMRGASGYEFSGKVILGNFPETIRRMYPIVQIPL
jgi:hypothetical protein